MVPVLLLLRWSGHTCMLLHVRGCLPRRRWSIALVLLHGWVVVVATHWRARMVAVGSLLLLKRIGSALLLLQGVTLLLTCIGWHGATTHPSGWRV